MPTSHSSIHGIICKGDRHQVLELFKGISKERTSQRELVKFFEKTNVEFPMHLLYEALVEAEVYEDHDIVRYLVTLPKFLMKLVDVAVCVTRCLNHCLQLPKTEGRSREIAIMTSNVKLTRVLCLIKFIWQSVCEGNYGIEPISFVEEAFARGGLARLLSLFTSQLANVDAHDINFLRKSIDLFQYIMYRAWNGEFLKQYEFYSISDLEAMLRLCSLSPGDSPRNQLEKRQAAISLRFEVDARKAIPPSDPRSIKLAWSSCTARFEDVPLESENAPGALLNLLAFSRTKAADANASTVVLFRFFQRAYENTMQIFPDGDFMKQMDCRPGESLEPAHTIGEQPETMDQGSSDEELIL